MSMSGSKTHQILWDSLVRNDFLRIQGCHLGYIPCWIRPFPSWGIYPSQMPRFFVKKCSALRDESSPLSLNFSVLFCDISQGGEFLWAWGPASHKILCFLQGPHMEEPTPAGHHRDILNGSRIDMQKPQQNWKPPSAKTGILRELLCNTWEV